MTSPIQAAIEQRRVTIAGARLRQTEIVITPDEAEAATRLIEAATPDAPFDSVAEMERWVLAVQDAVAALAEAITHRSPT